VKTEAVDHEDDDEYFREDFQEVMKQQEKEML